MSFSTMQFPEHVPSFAPHADVLAYLHRYCEQYQLRQLCKFNTAIERVSKPNHSGTDPWQVVTVSGETHQFDVVLVCNGHYSLANQWATPGIDDFLSGGGQLVHSQYYKTNAPYVDKRVLVIGSGPSGVDIAQEISQVASMAYASHRKPQSIYANCPRPNLKEIPVVQQLTKDRKAILSDGTILQDIDCIVACTGYRYQFPFLQPGTAGVSVTSDGRAVRGLVRHLFASKDPTLAFIGLPCSVVPFPLFEDQAYVMQAIYTGKIPGQKLLQIRAEGEEEQRLVETMGIYYHRIGDGQWEYRRQLACLVGRDPVQSSVAEVYRDSSAARKRDPSSYRKLEYDIFGDGPEDWRVTNDGVDVTGREDPGHA